MSMNDITTIKIYHIVIADLQDYSNIVQILVP